MPNSAPVLFASKSSSKQLSCGQTQTTASVGWFLETIKHLAADRKITISVRIHEPLSESIPGLLRSVLLPKLAPLLELQHDAPRDFDRITHVNRHANCDSSIIEID